MPDSYRYKASIKSKLSDELLNTYVLRPLAGLLVKALYFTPLMPNHVTIASIVAGLSAAVLYASSREGTVAFAGLLVTLKDLLDSADGQLARAKNQFSRSGRFLDSIGDFVVNGAVFAGIGALLYRTSDDVLMLLWAFLAFGGLTLRVSYHVFYQVSYLHLEGAYLENRITEEITESDRLQDTATLRLQQVFFWIYGWQDRWMAALDGWCRGGQLSEDFRQRWYSDMIGLRLSGLLGLGTELFLVMICSLFNALEFYLLLNILIMNGILVASISYRRWVVLPRLTSSRGLS